MDGSGASGGEGCLGRFRHLRALLVVPWWLCPGVSFRTYQTVSRSSTLKSLDSVAVSMGSAASRRSHD
jgi:hypothetical protein